MTTIPVIVDDTSDNSSETLGILSPTSRLKELDMEKIRTSLTQLSGQIGEMFQGLKSAGPFQLQQVQLQVAITAEGGIALIGLTKAGVSGAITLTFTV